MLEFDSTIKRRNYSLNKLFYLRWVETYPTPGLMTIQNIVIIIVIVIIMMIMIIMIIIVIYIYIYIYMYVCQAWPTSAWSSSSTPWTKRKYYITKDKL